MINYSNIEDELKDRLRTYIKSCGDNSRKVDYGLAEEELNEYTKKVTVNAYTSKGHYQCSGVCIYAEYSDILVTDPSISEPKLVFGFK